VKETKINQHFKKGVERGKIRTMMAKNLVGQKVKENQFRVHEASAA